MRNPSILFPQRPYGTQGIGVQQFPVDGEFQAIPNTGTPPFGEPVLYDETSELPFPVDPPFSTAREDDFLHEQINGTPWHGYEIGEWVNPSNPGIPNLGPPNVQDFQSGHSQIAPHNPSAEQGWGLDPAILQARYPHSENINPFYATGTHRRNGALEFSSQGLPFGSVTQQHVQAQSAVTRGRSTVHQRLADNPIAVPYSSTVVPVPGNAGPMNLIPAADEGIYE